MQRHRSKKEKRKEKTYTKAVITHTLHTPSGNSKTNSQWLLHRHDSSACDRTLEHANTCVGVITCVTEYVCGSLNPCQRSHTSYTCFANLFFPAEKWNISRLWTAGVWGDGGAWVVTLWILKRKKNKKYGRTGLISKRGKQKTCFHVWVHYCQTVCPPVPSVVTQVSERRGEERWWRHGLGEMSYYNNNAPSKSVIQWQHFILSRQLQQSTIVQKKWKKSIDNRSDG